MYLFNEQLNKEQDWERIFQVPLVFAPLVEHILKKENLPLAEIENLTPGINAVFKVGEYVIKIFAPEESGVEQRLPQTEIFAAQKADLSGVLVPKIVASGVVEDKYRFAYLITEYVDAVEIAELVDVEKIAVGRKLRELTNKMNVPCELGKGIDIMNDKARDSLWDKYSEEVKKERLAYVKSHQYGENVLVHTDLCGDNILLTPKGELYIIDFADVILAPKIYEHAALALDSGIDPLILRGYFHDYTVEKFTEMCFNGLLIIDYDPEMVEPIIGKPDEFQTLDDLRKRINQRMKGVINGEG